MNKEPFFIVGVGRSGTTMLRLMLTSHPSIAVPYESHFLTRYYEKLDSYGALEQRENLETLLRDILSEELLLSWDHEFDFDELISEIAEPVTLGSVFNAVYLNYARAKNKVRWGDKSDYLDRMHIVYDIFPDAKFIHIVRDGRDVVNSVLKLPWGPKDILAGAEWWSDHVKMAQIVGRVLGKSRYLVVKYEDLVANPESELTRVCEFLGEEFSADMLNYHKTAKELIPEQRRAQHQNTDGPPKSDRCYAWKNEMCAAYQGFFSRVCDSTLNDLGYEIPDTEISNLQFKKLKIKSYLKRSLSFS